MQAVAGSLILIVGLPKPLELSEVYHCIDEETSIDPWILGYESRASQYDFLE